MSSKNGYRTSDTAKDKATIARYWWNEELTEKQRIKNERNAIRLMHVSHRMGPYGLAELLLAIARLVNEVEDGIVERTDEEETETEEV